MLPLGEQSVPQLQWLPLATTLAPVVCCSSQDLMGITSGPQTSQNIFLIHFSFSSQALLLSPIFTFWVGTEFAFQKIQQTAFQIHGNHFLSGHPAELMACDNLPLAGPGLPGFVNVIPTTHTTISFWSFDKAEVGGVRKNIRTNQMFPPCNRERSHKDNPTGADAQVLRETCLRRLPQKITAQRPRLTYRLFSQ